MGGRVAIEEPQHHGAKRKVKPQTVTNWLCCLTGMILGYVSTNTVTNLLASSRVAAIAGRLETAERAIIAVDTRLSRIEGTQFITVESEPDDPVEYPRKLACPMCAGTKVMIEGSTGKEHPCPECKGSGERPEYEWETRESCPTCKGAGHVDGKECESCEGCGFIFTYGRIGDRIRNRPKPIQKITTNIKDSTANAAQGAKWVAVGIGAGCLGVPLFVLVLIVLSSRRQVVVREGEGKHQ